MIQKDSINKEKANLYASVFDNKNGRELLNDLISFTGFMSDTFVPNDPYTTAYSAGQRRVILRILGFVNKSHLIDLANKNSEKESLNER